jgi:hypothetical protein
MGIKKTFVRIEGLSQTVLFSMIIGSRQTTVFTKTLDVASGYWNLRCYWILKRC